MDERTFKSWIKRPMLEKCSTRYYGYNAVSPIAIIAQFTTEVKFKDHSSWFKAMENAS